jgi:hypothetical protein
MQAAESEKAPHRSNSTSLKGSVGSLRHKISSPIELIHTTNMLSYNAPDIHPMSASSTGSSQRSDDDMSDSALTNGTTPPTSPDVESPAKRSLSPEPNHLSCFFTVPAQQTPAPAAQPEAPVIPQRAGSHSKKQYNTLVRQRSASALSQQSHRTVSTKASFSFSRSSSTSTSTSVSSAAPYHKSKLSGTASASASPVAAPFNPSSPPRPQRQQLQQQHRKDYSETQHPFGPELAQVSELAEEYGVKEQVTNVADTEEQEMLAKGLLKFSADEYLSEVRGLFASFMVPPRPVAAAWI